MRKAYVLISHFNGAVWDGDIKENPPIEPSDTRESDRCNTRTFYLKGVDVTR